MFQWLTIGRSVWGSFITLVRFTHVVPSGMSQAWRGAVWPTRMWAKRTASRRWPANQPTMRRRLLSFMLCPIRNRLPCDFPVNRSVNVKLWPSCWHQLEYGEQPFCLFPYSAAHLRKASNLCEASTSLGLIIGSDLIWDFDIPRLWKFNPGNKVA